MTENNNNIDIKDEHDAESIDDLREWHTCCSNSSIAFIKYVVTVSISLVVLVFSLIMISLNPDVDNSIYFSLISSIVSVYIPSPTMGKKT